MRAWAWLGFRHLLFMGGWFLGAASLTWAQGLQPQPPSCEEQRVYWQNYVGYLGEQRKALEAELVNLRGQNAWLQSQVTEMKRSTDERASTGESADKK